MILSCHDSAVSLLSIPLTNIPLTFLRSFSTSPWSWLRLAAVVDQSLVLCLPGKPAGAVECLGFVADSIPHCVEVLREVPASC